MKYVDCYGCKKLYCHINNVMDRVEEPVCQVRNKPIRLVDFCSMSESLKIENSERIKRMRDER